MLFIKNGVVKNSDVSVKNAHKKERKKHKKSTFSFYKKQCFFGVGLEEYLNARLCILVIVLLKVKPLT